MLATRKFLNNQLQLLLLLTKLTKCTYNNNAIRVGVTSTGISVTHPLWIRLPDWAGLGKRKLLSSQIWSWQ